MNRIARVSLNTRTPCSAAPETSQMKRPWVKYLKPLSAVLLKLSSFSPSTQHQIIISDNVTSPVVNWTTISRDSEVSAPGSEWSFLRPLSAILKCFVLFLAGDHSKQTEGIENTMGYTTLPNWATSCIIGDWCETIDSPWLNGRIYFEDVHSGDFALVAILATFLWTFHCSMQKFATNAAPGRPGTPFRVCFWEHLQSQEFWLPASIVTMWYLCIPEREGDAVCAFGWLWWSVVILGAAVLIWWAAWYLVWKIYGTWRYCNAGGRKMGTIFKPAL